MPITSNKQVKIETRLEVLTSAGAQVLVASGYALPDLEVIETFWENRKLFLDGVFKPVLDTHFPPTALNDLEMGGSSEIPIVLDEEEVKENSLPSTPVSD